MYWTEFSFILKPSSLGGVGVFTTHDIARGTVIFNQDINHNNIRVLKIKAVPKDLVKYCVFINDEECFCPERFDRMEIDWYLNHSNDPNIAKKDIAKMNFTNNIQNFHQQVENHKYYAIKDIKTGDEILIDYNELNEPEHLKEAFYKL